MLNTDKSIAEEVLDFVRILVYTANARLSALSNLVKSVIKDKALHEELRIEVFV